MEYRNLVAALALSTALAARADALEVGASNQYTPCFLCGIATGALPGPGWYFQNTIIYEYLTRYDNFGNRQPITLDNFVDVPQLAWVPDIGPVLGATYAASLLEPLTRSRATIAGAGTFARAGVADTVFAPAVLSWALPHLTFVSASFILYVPDGAYTRGSELNIGDNYWTFEPSGAVSYLDGGWNLTVHGAVDVNSRDAGSDTTTGDILYTDLTATKAFGRWDAGLVGNWVAQFTRDVGPAALPNEKRISIGPTISYQIGSVQARFFITRDVVIRNGFGGNNFWIRLFVPFANVTK